MSELTIATIIFVATYALIISERLDRTVVALAGAGLMIAFGVLNQRQALEAIDPNTIALLVGMMIIINILKRTGVFRYAGWRSAIALGAIRGGCSLASRCSRRSPRRFSTTSLPSS